MADLGALYVRVLADVKAFGKDLKTKMATAEEEAGASGKKVGGGFSKGLLAAGSAFAGLELVKYLGSAGHAASELNVDIGRTGEVFGTSGKAVLDWSKKSATNLGMSQDAALTTATNFGVMYESMGLSSKGAAALSEKAISLGNDLSTFYKKDPAVGINAIRMASLGAYRGLRQFGISITKTDVTAQALSMHLGTTTVNTTKLATAQVASDKAAAHVAVVTNSMRLAQIAYNDAVAKHGKGSADAQKALIKLSTAQLHVKAAQDAAALSGKRVQAVLSSGKTVLTAAQKAQATYALITERSRKAEGSFAKEGGSLEVQQRRTSAQFANMKTQLGTAVLPIMTTVGNLLATKIAPAFAKLAGVIAKNRAWLVPLISVLALLVVTIKGVTAVMNVWKQAMAILKPITAAMTTEEEGLNLAFMANPIVLVVVAIVALIAILVIAYMKVGWFRAAVDAAFNGVKVAAEWVWHAINVAFHAIVNAISWAIAWLRKNWPLVVGILLGPVGIVVALIITHWNQVKALTAAAWNGLLNIVRSVANFIVGVVSGFVSRVVGFFTGLPGALTGFGSQMIHGFLNGITSAWGAVTGWLRGVGGNVLRTIGNAELWLLHVGEDIVKGLVNGITGAWHLVTDKISSLVGAIPGAAKKVLHILSPSTVMADEVGQWISKGIAHGIEQHGSSVQRAVNGLPMNLGAHSVAAVAAGGGGPMVGTMVLNALDPRHLAPAVADQLAYLELRGQMR